MTVFCPNCSAPMAASLVACTACERATYGFAKPTDPRITPHTWAIVVEAWRTAREMRMLRGVA